MSASVSTNRLKRNATAVRAVMSLGAFQDERREDAVVGWKGVTPAAAALLQEQDLKPVGAAFPEPLSRFVGEKGNFAPRRIDGVRSLGNASSIRIGSLRRRLSIKGSRRKVSRDGGMRKTVGSGVETESAQSEKNLERFSTEYHKPVLPREVCASLRPESGRWFLDMTLGGGGHSEMLLEHGASVVGIDQDCEALAHASARLARYGRRFRAIHGSFAHAVELVEATRSVGLNADVPARFDGVLMDLGVSSHQLDAAERGFSFMREGPLDMRMNAGAGIDAASVVNTYPESDLARIFREFGEEPSAKRIARMIVERRAAGLFTTTLQLASAVEAIVPRRGRVHPATRVFQALRMEVNHELEALERGLNAACALLAPGGTLAVISFHSLEDRMVKRFMRHRSSPEIDRPEWPAPRPNPDHVFVKGGGRHQEAEADEVAWNPRSRSAKLRCVDSLQRASRAP